MSKRAGGSFKVSEFQSFRVSRFEGFKVRKWQSFKVAKFKAQTTPEALVQGIQLANLHFVT